MRAGGVDLRLVAPAVAAWLSAGILVAAPQRAWWCVGAMGVLILVAAALARMSRPRWTGAAILVLTAVGVAAAATAGAGATRHPAAIDTVASGHYATIEATVASTTRDSARSAFGGGRVSFRVTARTVRVGDTQIAGRMPALVYAASGSRAPQIGERVRVTGSVQPSEPADSIAFLVFSGRWRHEAPPPLWLSWADGLRARFAAASALLPGDGGALLPGLSIGDDSHVSAGLDADMKASSLSHLTAVSGSNCAIIIAGLLGLAAAAGLARGWRVAVGLVGLGGFVVLVTPGASVLRAAVMAAIVVFGTALGRPGRALPALALAVIVLIVQNPWLARDYGFALSVLATAALLVFARPLAARLERWLPRWLALGLSVPLAAQLACQPVLVLLNPTIPLYGVIANVLAEPAAPIATVIGLIGCLALPCCAPLATPVLWCAWVPSAWIAGIARTSVALPASALPWPAGITGFTLATVLTGLVVVVVARPTSVRGRRMRGALGGASVLILVVAAGVATGPVLVARAAMPRDWVVGMCDIGQGDAIVLHSGADYGLIDTGRDPQALTTCMHRLGIRHLALLVLTHYDADHVGGVAAVARMARLAVVGTPPADDASARRRLLLLRSQHVPIHFAARGDEGTLGELRWHVLWPDSAHPEMGTSNEGGVTISVSGAAEPSMIFLADLDAKAQDALISDGGLARVDVVKVAHHGSSDQSERLYGLLGAQLGLISAGLGNDYGHPTAKALALLHAAGTQVARTDLEGMALVTDRDGRLGLWTEKHATRAALWAPASR